MEKRFVDIHTHKSDPDPEVLCLRSFGFGRDESMPPEPFSAGVHPWDAGTADLTAAQRFLQTVPAVAIGEIGLDYLRPADRKIQRQALEMQLEIAVRRNLPVILHCVKAYNDLYAILKDHSLRGVIFHGYTGSPQQTRQLEEAGYCFSLGPVSFRSPRTMEALRAMPPERLFLETDTVPLSVRKVYDQASAALGVAPEALQRTLIENYKRIFV